METHCSNNGRIPNDKNSDSIYECHLEKQPFRSISIKRCSENMQKNNWRPPMQKCDFNKVALLYTSTRVFSSKFVVYFQNTSRGLLLHQVTEIQNQPEIITSAEKFFTKAANIVEIIPANQNESTDEDESKQNNTIDRMSVKVHMQ